MFTNKLFIYISHVRISHKVKGVLMRNFRHNIFIRRQKDIGRFSNLHSVPLRSTINKKNRKKLHQQAFLTLHIHSSCKNSRCSQRKQYMFTSQVVHARLTSSAPPLLQLFNWVLIGRSPLFTQEKSRPDISSFHWLLSHLFDDILLKSYQALRMAFMAVRNEWSMNHWIYDVTTRSDLPTLIAVCEEMNLHFHVHVVCCQNLSCLGLPQMIYPAKIVQYPQKILWGLVRTRINIIFFGKITSTTQYTAIFLTFWRPILRGLLGKKEKK